MMVSVIRYLYVVKRPYSSVLRTANSSAFRIGVTIAARQGSSTKAFLVVHDEWFQVECSSAEACSVVLEQETQLIAHEGRTR